MTLDRLGVALPILQAQDAPLCRALPAAALTRALAAGMKVIPAG